ncbi:MAG: glycosyltransferase family 4 protein [Anaerolineales bacterium]|nr:glycosyltransferase family 4 protein [Anaerolineales bacterium]
MDIAFLAGIDTRSIKGGGSVHAGQVSRGLLKNGHRLYTNIADESNDFRKFRHETIRRISKDIEVFYIRIDGAPDRDRWTLYRRFNPDAVCLWEINAPVQELRTRNIPEQIIGLYHQKRRMLAKLVDAAICVSDEMAAYARDDLGIEDVFVVPNGSDPELFSPKGRDPRLFEPKKFKMIWTGSPEYPWQGLHIVQEVARRLWTMDRDIQLIVTSEGNSTDNITYVGKLPYNIIPKYIASADAGLCVYGRMDYYKEFYFSPLKLYDYMSCAIPVIGSDIGQIKHVLKENDNGLLVDDSIEDIISKIIYLKLNQKIGKEMGERGRKAVLEKYNWGNVVANTEKIMKDIQGSIHSKDISRRIKFLITRKQWVCRQAYWEVKSRFAAMMSQGIQG